MKFFSVLVCSVFLFWTGLSNASKAYLCPMLVFAAGDGDLEYVKSLLLSGANVNCEENNMRPISSAVNNNHVQIVKYLLEKDAEVDNTELLCWASERGHVEIAEFLIKKRGANVNGVDNNGRTPLFLAYYKNDYYRNRDIVRLLIEHGANYTELIHPKFHLKIHLIELAVCYGDFELVQFLVDEKKVDVNVIYNGQTLLHDAAESLYRPVDPSVEGHEKIVEFLLSRGADPKIKNENGKTAFDLALEKDYGSVARVLA